MKVRIVGLAIAGLMVGCGPSQKDYDTANAKAADLEKQVATLKAEIEELKYGPEKLLSQASTQFEQQQFEAATKTIDQLIARHPDTEQASKAKALQVKVTAAAQEAEAKKQQAELAAKAQAEKARAVAMANMKRDTDEIKGITWVRHKQERPLTKKLALYFGTRNNNTSGMPLRMTIQYVGDDWLFVNSVTIKADDRVIDLGKLEFERDHSYGSVWEWADIVADHNHLDTIMNAKRVVVRFDGDKYYSDFTLPAAQQAQMREVFTAWKSIP